MRRRRFVGGTLVVTAAGSVAVSGGSSAGSPSPDAGAERLARVRGAMLSMQRASWEQGVAAQAFLEGGDEEQVLLMAKEAALRQTEEGRLSVLYTDNGVTDPAASGEAVLHAARVSGDEELRQAAERMAAYLLEEAPRTDDGTLHHTLSEPEIWVDSMYMAPPFLAVAGHPEEAVRQLDGIGRRLWSRETRLYAHRWHEGRQELVNPKAWGVGNGWAMAGLARVVDALPDRLSSEGVRLARRARETLDGCLAHLRPDGLFHNVVDEPGSFVETNLSQMAAYTIFRGIRSGWLSPSYLPRALEMREAAHGQVDEQGYVRGVCGAPFFDAPGRATEGQAFFLLMEAAHAKLDG